MAVVVVVCNATTTTNATTATTGSGVGLDRVDMFLHKCAFNHESVT